MSDLLRKRSCPVAVRYITWSLGLAFSLVAPAGAGETSVKSLDRGAAVDHGTALEQGADSAFVFKYLIGEIAGQRGDYNLGSSAFYDLAKSTQDARLAERAAKSAIQARNLNQAIAAINLWIQLAPDALEPRQLMVQVALSQNKLEDARPHIEKLLKDENARAGGFVSLNGLLEKQTDKQAVLALVQGLAAPYPALAEAHFAVAHAAWIAKNDALALAECQRVEKLSPGWEINALLQGQVLFAESPDKGIAFYRSYLAKFADSGQIRINLTRMLVNERRLAEAKTELEALKAYHALTPEMSVVAGLLASQVEAYTLTEYFMQSVLNTNYQDKAQIYLYLGQLAEKQQDDAKAITWYEQVVEGKHLVEAKINLANIYSRTRSVDEAIALLDALQNLDNDQLAMVIQAQANLLNQAKRLDEAYDLLGKASGNLPENAAILYDYAMLAERLNKTDISEKELRKLIKMKPEFAQAYNALGYSFADRNIHLEEAKNLLEKALSLSPNDHYIMDSMGWVEFRLGQLDKAEDYLRKAYAIQADPEIGAHLGEVLWQQGKQDEAKKIWESAQREHQDNDVLRDTVKKYFP